MNRWASWSIELAHAAARGRRRLRTALSIARFKAELATAADAGDDALRAAFVRFDTSGDGFLQPGELKYAWKAATGEVMSDDDADAMVRSIDADGNGEIDVDEFIALVRDHL